MGQILPKCLAENSRILENRVRRLKLSIAFKANDNPVSFAAQELP
jgi:hypothetical protein